MYIKPEFLTLWNLNLNLMYIPLLVSILNPLEIPTNPPDKKHPLGPGISRRKGTQQSPEVLPSSATWEMMVMYLQFFFGKMIR